MQNQCNQFHNFLRLEEYLSTLLSLEREESKTVKEILAILRFDRNI